MPKPKGYTEIVNLKNRVDGCWVRLKSRGESFSEFFKFSAYKSKAETRKAARECYRQLVLEHPKMSRQENAQRKTSRTGETIGVRRLLKIDKRWGGNAYEVWEARWSHKKYQRRVKTFSIEKYGEEEARRLAIEARLQGLAEMGER
ncbi:MAG: AP2 domain-containing protein [Pyrinomonadaceae bacterium]|nr:AP2 domain-containing protein [Pyrinomonadaceae bacterium]